MTYEELKRRIKDEGLDAYSFIRFDTLYGPEFSLSVRKESDGTCSRILRGERDAIIFEERNKPEQEICEKVYQSAVSEKEVELAFQERQRQIHK